MNWAGDSIGAGNFNEDRSWWRRRESNLIYAVGFRTYLLIGLAELATFIVAIDYRTNTPELTPQP